MKADGVSVQPAQPAPVMAWQDDMNGEAIVDLRASTYLKLGRTDDAGSGSGALPKTDSWLDLKEGSKEAQGMHVTFSVRLLVHQLAYCQISTHEQSIPTMRVCNLTYRCCREGSRGTMHGIFRAGTQHALLLCQDVYYIVKNRANKAEKLSILAGISGYFSPGEMAAVMGPSGAGACAACLGSMLPGSMYT